MAATTVAPRDDESIAEAFRTAYETPTTIRGRLSAVSHKQVGRRFVVTSLVFFALGGLEALAIRTQLIRPENDLLNPEAYNDLFTMHGSTMMFFFAVPFMEGIANYLVPLMIGARDLPFPRFNAFNYWLYLAGGVLLYSSFVVGQVPDGGWFGYTPLTGPVYSPDKATDFWLTGITLAEVSAIGAAIELLVSIFKTRAPGMTLSRMPLFVWAMAATSVMIIIGFTPLVLGSALLESDRTFGTAFYDADLGGSPVLWQHFFWIFGHPEVYVMFLPATGIVSQVVQSFTGRRIVGYAYVVAALVAVGFLSLGLWVHHMFTVGIPALSLAFFSAASLVIAIPSGIQIFAWISTIWSGRPRFRTPLLFVIGFVVIFVLGGITGVMVAVAPFDWQAHDSYFLVAHFHYVLIGGVVFPALAGLYYWFPKVTGRLMDERLGVASFVLAFVGFNVAFLPMHVTGLLGMPRRVFTYPDGAGWGALNLTSTLGAYVLATGFLLSLVNLLRSRTRGEESGDDPWGADTLEWATTSPPPPYNFRRLPVAVTRHPKWDDPAADVPSEHEASIVDTLAQHPTDWRCTLGTTPIDARPEEVAHLPGPTLVPLVPAAGIVTATVALLVSSWWVGLAGIAVAVVGFLAWVVVNERERRLALRGYEPVEDLDVDVSGPRGVGWWGLVLVLVVGLVVYASAVVAYYYLQFHNEAWPPLVDVGYPPPLGAASIAAVLVLAATAVVSVAARGDSRRWSAAASLLVVGAVLGAAALVAGAFAWGDLEHPRSTDAYTSAVAMLLVLTAAAILIGVAALLAVAATGGWLGGRRAAFLVRHGTLVWWFATVATLVTWVVVYGIPRLGT